MTILEHRSNFPTAVGKKNVPTQKEWGIDRPIGDLLSVRGIGRDQLLPQAGVTTDISVVHDPESLVHNLLSKQHLPQGVMGLGIRERLQFRLGKLKGRFPMFGQAWGPDRRIADLPKPMSILSGPEHPMHPDRSIALEM